MNINHKFINHKIQEDTKVLIIGTFHPETSSGSDFFYGRSRNFLWRLLSKAFGNEDLKDKPREEKIEFIRKNKVDFIDLIRKINIQEGHEKDYFDEYLDSRMSEPGSEWNDVVALISGHNSLRKVCFTRKTFQGILNIENKINEIREFCENSGIGFQCLVTPARYHSEAKQREWNTFFA